jgi:hypothetical protein
MMKVFYYPAYFYLRRFGDTKALVLATLLTFAATWVLHIVQWFWIRSSILREWNDILFWSIFAGLVVVNAVYEARHVRPRTLVTRQRTVGESAGLVLRTVATFATICALWSFWTAESITDWLLMCAAGLRLPQWTAPQYLALVAALAGGGILAVYAAWQGWWDAPRAEASRTSPGVVVAAGLVLCAVATPSVVAVAGVHSEVLDSLRLASASALNRRDAENFQRGYYENLLDVSRFNPELAQRYDQMPADFVRSLTALGLSRSTGDEQGYELVPLKAGRFVGAMVQTNRWGMRDRDYPQARPDGIYRIALLGPSTAMGSGVEADESFEALIEERLNREAGGSTPAIEVLNFGVAGYSPLHMLYQLDRKVLPFQPDAALFLGHSSDISRASARWVAMAQQGSRLGADPYLKELAQRTGIRPSTGSNEARRRIRPYEDELLAWVYRRFVEDCRAAGVVPVFVYMETVTERTEPWRAADRADVLRLARGAGFVVLDLTGAYGAHAPAELWIAENDGHPNALGNRLLADRLLSLLREREHEIPMSAPRHTRLADVAEAGLVRSTR